ncbi:PD-(D/E)XK nuclease family protein [Gracilimonas sp.]|uniref:PD-(D/E)XK nuclease family protein n=1 Tax=Gracilimonas sp. TaxID=1974203 RepID=UPI003D0FCCB8
MNIVKPNIFSFGTTELTQDAMIAWLVAWADPIYKESESALHHLGKSIVEDIFFVSGVKISELRSVKVQTQFKKIDVYVIINDKYHIIIEDKTFGDTSEVQIERYVNKLKKEGIDALNILPIYYKTRDQAITKQDGEMHPILTRQEMLKLINESLKNGLSHDLVLEYNTYLQSIEDEVQSYKTTAPSSWDHPQWKGFLQYVNDYFLDGSWKYVPNKSGGFMGFWWNRKGNIGGHNIYLQIEESKLCFKISDASGDEFLSKNAKWGWIKRIRTVANELDLPVDKPKYLGNGKRVTFAVWHPNDSETWIPTKENGSPDLEQAVKRLQSTADLLDKTVETYDGE